MLRVLVDFWRQLQTVFWVVPVLMTAQCKDCLQFHGPDRASSWVALKRRQPALPLSFGPGAVKQTVQSREKSYFCGQVVAIAIPAGSVDAAALPFPASKDRVDRLQAPFILLGHALKSAGACSEPTFPSVRFWVKAAALFLSPSPVGNSWRSPSKGHCTE